MTETLLSLKMIAERLDMSPLKLRRTLPIAIKNNPALRPIRAGRSLLFTERDYGHVREGFGLPSLTPPTPLPPLPPPMLSAYWARVFNRARRGATVRNISYALTVDDALLIVDRSRGVCEVSGLPFSHAFVGSKNWKPYAPSVDRIDSGGVYELSNCRLVSCAVNAALGSWGDEVLLRIARGIMQKHGDENV